MYEWENPFMTSSVMNKRRLDKKKKSGEYVSPLKPVAEEESLADSLYRSVFKEPKTPGEPRYTPHGFPLKSTSTPRYDIEQNKRTNYLNRLNLMSSSPTTHYYDKNGQMVKRVMKPEWEKKGYYFDPSGKMQRRSIFPDLEGRHQEAIVAAKDLYEKQKMNKINAQIEKGFMTQGLAFGASPEYNRFAAQKISRGESDPSFDRDMMSIGSSVDSERERIRMQQPIQPKSAEWKQLESAVITMANAAQSYFGNDPQRVKEVVDMTENAFRAATPGNVKGILSSIDAKVGIWKSQATETRLKEAEKRDEKYQQWRRNVNLEKTIAESEKEEVDKYKKTELSKLYARVANLKDPNQLKGIVESFQKQHPDIDVNISTAKSWSDLGTAPGISPNVMKQGDELKALATKFFEATQRKGTFKEGTGAISIDGTKDEGKWIGQFDMESPHDQAMVSNLLHIFGLPKEWLGKMKDPQNHMNFYYAMLQRIPEIIEGYPMLYEMPGTQSQGNDPKKKQGGLGDFLQKLGIGSTPDAYKR